MGVSGGKFFDRGVRDGGVVNYLSCLVLGNLVLGVLLALLTLAVGASGLWDVDLGENVSFVVGGFSRSCVSRALDARSRRGSRASEVEGTRFW